MHKEELQGKKVDKEEKLKDVPKDVGEKTSCQSMPNNKNSEDKENAEHGRRKENEFIVTKLSSEPSVETEPLNKTKDAEKFKY